MARTRAETAQAAAEHPLTYTLRPEKIKIKPFPEKSRKNGGNARRRRSQGKSDDKKKHAGTRGWEKWLPDQDSNLD